MQQFELREPNHLGEESEVFVSDGTEIGFVSTDLHGVLVWKVQYAKFGQFGLKKAG